MIKSFLILLIVFSWACAGPRKTTSPAIINIPAGLQGNFTDDYGITYSIHDSVWVQNPNIKYHLLEYNTTGQYFIARNDDHNPSDAGLYTRIDIMYFNNVDIWTWGYCLTVYNAASFGEAVSTAAADRNNPKKGCGNYPFSRMKKMP